MGITTPIVREEKPSDEAAIRHVLNAAFPGPLEAQLIDDLRRAGNLTISLVAEIDGQVVGHVAFSPVAVAKQVRGLGLAPLAVLPSVHRKGVGTTLAKAGIAKCRQLGTGFIVVLGSPAYYERFGFQPASKWSLTDEYEGGAAFQTMELIPGAVPAGGGLVQYGPEFAIFAP
jgi:putative acetyltransferase